MMDSWLRQNEPVFVFRDFFNCAARIGSTRSTAVLLLLVLIGRGRFESGSLSFVLRRASLLLAGVRRSGTLLLDSGSLLDDLHILLLRRRGFLSLFEIESVTFRSLGFREIPKTGGPSGTNGLGEAV